MRTSDEVARCYIDHVFADISDDTRVVGVSRDMNGRWVVLAYYCFDNKWSGGQIITKRYHRIYNAYRAAVKAVKAS